MRVALAAGILLAACAGPEIPENDATLRGFQIRLPVAAADTAANLYGIWPFGVHGADHALDGHPGWDIEVKIGASARAAADGVVRTVMPGGLDSTKITVQIEHAFQGRLFRTVYTNMTSLAPGIAVNAAVVVGQPVGVPGVHTQMVGAASATWSAFHFQLDDFLVSNSGTTNPMAVGPEMYLDTPSRALFAALWARAAYAQELGEPFSANPRLVSFPNARTWTLVTGVGPARLDVTRTDPASSAFAWALRDASGVVIDTGALTLASPRAGTPHSIDLTSNTGPARLALADVVSDTLRLALGTPGAPRPASLAGATRYTTQRP